MIDRIRRLSLNVLALALLGLAPAAHAFLINIPRMVQVREYVNDITGHYVMLSDFQEAQGVERGAAGPGWRFTGYYFMGYALEETLGGGSEAVPVCRFYAPAPTNSHFYTANAAECEFLRTHDTGWNFEKVEFKIQVPKEGRCATGLTPIYRAYNNRWMFNDSNHRFSPDERVRGKLVSQGWVDEGIAFCSTSGGKMIRDAFTIFGNERAPSAECANRGTAGSCVALGALADMNASMMNPTMAGFGEPNPSYTPRFAETTGWLPFSDRIYAATFAEGTNVAADHSFVEWVPSGMPIGVHVNGEDRLQGDYASVSPLYRFMSTAPLYGTSGQLVQPWADGRERDLFLGFQLAVKTIRRADAQSHAYGHPLLDFRDLASGGHINVTLQTYGTNAPGDFVAADVNSGHVIVSTAFGPNPAFGTRLVGDYIRCEADAVSGSCTAPEGMATFHFRLDRDDFARVVSLARGANPALSARVEDYALDTFQFRNETYRDARVGLEVYSVGVSISY